MVAGAVYAEAGQQDFPGRDPADWLPDGRSIVFSGNERGHSPRVYLQPIDAGPPRPVTPEGVSQEYMSHPVSPDGKLLVAFGQKVVSNGDDDVLEFVRGGKIERAAAALVIEVGSCRDVRSRIIHRRRAVAEFADGDDDAALPFAG